MMDACVTVSDCLEMLADEMNYNGECPRIEQVLKLAAAKLEDAEELRADASLLARALIKTDMAYEMVGCPRDSDEEERAAAERILGLHESQIPHSHQRSCLENPA